MTVSTPVAPPPREQHGHRCVSPVDLLPEAFVPLLGLADDGVVAFWLAGAFLAKIDRFLAWERSQAEPRRHALTALSSGTTTPW